MNGGRVIYVHDAFASAFWVSKAEATARAQTPDPRAGPGPRALPTRRQGKTRGRLSTEWRRSSDHRGPEAVPLEGTGTAEGRTADDLAVSHRTGCTIRPPAPYRCTTHNRDIRIRAISHPRRDASASLALRFYSLALIFPPPSRAPLFRLRKRRVRSFERRERKQRSFLRVSNSFFFLNTSPNDCPLLAALSNYFHTPPPPPPRAPPISLKRPAGPND